MIVLLGLLLPLATFAQQAVCPTIWNRGAPYFCTEREVQNGALGNGTYNKLVPPVEKFRVPVDVKMGLNVYKLVNLDIQAAQIDLSVWIRLSWTDKRLAWDTNTYNVSQTSYYASNSNEESVIWVPDLEMYNQERSVYECADKQAMVYPSGFVFWSRPCIVSALCSFNELSKMPFDKTSCEMEFGGWSRSGWDVYYIEADPPISFAQESSSLTTYQEYSLDEGSSTATTIVYTYPCCPNEPWPVIQYVIGFERATNYYVLKIIVPNILFTFLSFAPFWVDVRSGERLSFGITILLAMVAVDIIAADLLPICPEYLFIEALVGGSILFAFLSLVESCFVVYWYYKNEHEAEENVAVNSINSAAMAIASALHLKGKGSKDTAEGSGGNSETPITSSAHSRPSTHFDPSDDPGGGAHVDDSNTDMFLDCDEGPDVPPPPTAVRPSLTTMGSLRKRFKRSFTNKNAKENRKVYLRERNLNEANVLTGHRVDRASRWAFVVLYILFLTVMFATIPLWE
ncbi:hypothetical protein TrRE_jg8082 [Triparma retinervis]|uniref:Uncharacterized protein n=1 Tax=Triparma retinervis TaxID=2557542 RepID=A0A9W7DX35_9STRA|nr:hypothetical protein TrRE_jg8082 [Triparma retinervis]